MSGSRSTAKLQMEFLVKNKVSFYRKVYSSPYCCAVLLDPRLRNIHIIYYDMVRKYIYFTESYTLSMSAHCNYLKIIKKELTKTKLFPQIGRPVPHHSPYCPVFEH